MQNASVIVRLFLKASLLQRKRAVLTVAAIAWGTVAILMLLSFGEGLKRQLNKAKHGMGENLAVVWPGETSRTWEGLPAGRPIRLRADDVSFLRRKLPDLAGLVGEMTVWTVNLAHGAKSVTGRVVGTNAEFGEIRNFLPAPGGRFLDPMDEAEKRRVIFLGNELARDVFGAADPVGTMLLVNGSPYLVIGVMEKKLQMGSYGGMDAQASVIPLSTYVAQFGEQPLENIVFQVERPDQMAGAMKNFREALAAKYRFDPADNQALGVWDTVKTSAATASVFLGLQVFMGVIGALTLLVGGIGVANIMYAVVKEKTREIGVQMALGARRSFITAPFVLQGLAYTLAGGVIGTSVAVLLITLMSFVPVEGNRALEFLGKPTLSWPIAAATAAILGGMGILAGYFPARRAASIDPAATLRYE